MIYKESFNDNDDITNKHRCCQLIQYLITISDKKFKDEFDVKNE